MSDIFFNTEFIDYTSLLLKIIIFFATAAVLFYLLYFLFAKLLYRSNDRKFHRDLTLRLTLLWSIIALFFIFNVYLFFLIRIVGYENMRWSRLTTYFGLGPQLIVILVIIVLFISKYLSFQKSL